MPIFGEEVWSPSGVKVLGTPVGTATFVREHADKRLADESRLWGALQEVPDHQCAWQLLVQCAGPRANHLLRPSQSQSYAAAHDAGMWTAALEVLRGVLGHGSNASHAPTEVRRAWA